MGLEIDLNFDCEKDVLNGDDSNDSNDLHIDESNEKASKGPYIGMEFDSQDSAQAFYTDYAKEMGFGISIKASRSSKLSRQFIDVKYACTRYGTKRQSNAINPRPCLKMECKAMLHVKRRGDGKWYVENFMNDHNHNHNHESGDANAMLEYFVRMQEKNPRFFYAMNLDGDHRLKNVFRVDAKGRDDYLDFGDVVSFDTTYITNKYKMPFAPFIGVNNHYQSSLLGCALLADETKNPLPG